MLVLGQLKKHKEQIIQKKEIQEKYRSESSRKKSFNNYEDVFEDNVIKRHMKIMKKKKEGSENTNSNHQSMRVSHH